MFYHRCSLIKQINTTISEQDGTTDNLLVNVTSSSVIIFIRMLYTDSLIVYKLRSDF